MEFCVHFVLLHTFPHHFFYIKIKDVNVACLREKCMSFSFCVRIQNVKPFCIRLLSDIEYVTRFSTMFDLLLANNNRPWKFHLMKFITNISFLFHSLEYYKWLNMLSLKIERVSSVDNESLTFWNTYNMEMN